MLGVLACPAICYHRCSGHRFHIIRYACYLYKAILYIKIMCHVIIADPFVKLHLCHGPKILKIRKTSVKKTCNSVCNSLDNCIGSISKIIISRAKFLFQPVHKVRIQ